MTVTTTGEGGGGGGFTREHKQLGETEPTPRHTNHDTHEEIMRVFGGSEGIYFRNSLNALYEVHMSDDLRKRRLVCVMWQSMMLG